MLNTQLVGKGNCLSGMFAAEFVEQLYIVDARMSQNYKVERRGVGFVVVLHIKVAQMYAVVLQHLAVIR